MLFARHLAKLAGIIQTHAVAAHDIVVYVWLPSVPSQNPALPKLVQLNVGDEQAGNHYEDV